MTAADVRSSRVGVGIPGASRHVGVPPFTVVLGSTLPIVVGETELEPTEIIAGSRRVSTIPGPSSGVGAAFGLPPFPPPRFMLAADVVAVVMHTIVVKPVARTAAVEDITVTAAANVRAFGGSFALSPALSAAVTASATARARFLRTATASAAVTASAALAVRRSATATASVTASATVSAIATVPAVEDITVTPSAGIVAVGGTVPLAPTVSIGVTASAAVVQRMAAALAVSTTVTASATARQRMPVSAAVSATVTPTATVRVNIGAALASTEVTATATSAQNKFPVGMNKTSSQLLTASTNASTADLLVDWVADAGKPGSLVESNGLRIPFAADGVVTATMTLSFSSVNHSRGLQLLADGAVIASDIVSGSRTTFSITFPGTSAAGMLLQLKAHATATQTGNRNVTAATLAFTPN